MRYASLIFSKERQNQKKKSKIFEITLKKNKFMFLKLIPK